MYALENVNSIKFKMANYSLLAIISFNMGHSKIGKTVPDICS